MRVLIVDDELLVRVAFKSLVDWVSYGFEICGEASNGEEAMKIFNERPAEIVVTDIKMPIMDGLSLIKGIKERRPETVVVMLSCYDDFDLVQKAFTLGAFDYVLKTEMNSEMLLELLIRAEKYFQEHISKEREHLENKRLLSRNMDKIKEAFFKQLIWNSRYQGQPLDMEIEKFGLRLNDKRNCIGIFKVDNIGESIRIYGDDGLQLFTFSVINIFEEILGEYGIGDVFSNNNEEYVVVFSFRQNIGIRDERSKLYELSTRIINSISKYIGVTISCGISGFSCEGYKSLLQLYRQAQFAYEYRFSLGKSKVIFYGDVSGLNERLDVEWNKNISCLKKFLFMPENSKMNGVLNNILIKGDALIKEDFNRVRQLYDEYFNILLDHIRNAGYEKDIEYRIQEFYDHIRISGTLSDYCNWFEVVLNEICTHNSSEGYLVQRVKRYVIENYHENITLIKVAGHMNVSMEHLSREFSKNAGCSFIKYLTGIRIERVKEYLKNTHLNAVEIADKVGYTSADYLSKAFKKETGYTLSEYRDQNKI
ncbi:MAG: response regulator [Clostridiaceae bacterium]